MDAADHRCLAELVRRRKKLGVDKLKQEMIRRKSPVLCNESYIDKLMRIDLVQRPKTCRKPHKQWFRGENVTILEWPSYSLHLDPIENVCENVSRMRSIRNVKRILKK